MTRKLLCNQTNELGNDVVVAKDVCRYAMKPATMMGCNDDIPCDRMYNYIVLSVTGQVTQGYNSYVLRNQSYVA